MTEPKLIHKRRRLGQVMQCGRPLASKWGANEFWVDEWNRVTCASCLSNMSRAARVLIERRVRSDCLRAQLNALQSQQEAS